MRIAMAQSMIEPATSYQPCPNVQLPGTLTQITQSVVTTDREAFKCATSPSSPVPCGCLIEELWCSAVSGARANNGSDQGMKSGGNIHSILRRLVFDRRMVECSSCNLPGSVDQLFPVSRQKSLKSPYLDMAGYALCSPVFVTIKEVAIVFFREAQRRAGTEWS